MEILEILKNQKNYRSLKGVNGKEIAKIERKMGIQFAEDYKAYIAHCGIACFSGHELTGICDSARLNVMTVTEEARKNNANVSEEMYVIEETGIDGIIIWQDKKGEIY